MNEPVSGSVPSKPEKPRESVTLSAAIMSIATFLSRVAGLIREQTFAYLFGAGVWTDAFNVAFRIPNLLRDLFAEGAMSAAFVPTFNSVLTKDGREPAFKLANITLSVLTVILGAVSVIGIFFSPWLVSLLAPEFSSVSGKHEVTVLMTRIMFPFLLAISLAAITMGVLNSLGKFFAPAVAPVFLNLSMIVAGFTLCPIFKETGNPAIIGMAIGAMLGGILQFAFQLIPLWRAGFRLAWMPRFGDPGMRRIVRLIIPGTIGLAATQINVAISTVLATSQGDGPVSWLNYAFRLMQLPLGLFGVAIAQATLPAFSRAAAQQDKESMAETLGSSIRLTAFINVTASLALLVLAEPMIRIIFQHGRFTAADTTATAYALQAYSIGLFSFSLIKVLGPAFYALNETRIPVFASMVSVAVNIVLNLALIGPFGYWGLALGSSIAAGVNALILYFYLSRRVERLRAQGIGGSLIKTLLAGGLAAGGAWGIHSFLISMWTIPAGDSISAGSGLWHSIGAFLFSSAGGVVLLVMAGRVLGIQELDRTFSMIKARLQRRRGGNKTPGIDKGFQQQ